jgi:hypothetical protein
MIFLKKNHNAIHYEPIDNAEKQICVHLNSNAIPRNYG